MKSSADSESIKIFNQNRCTFSVKINKKNSQKIYYIDVDLFR